MENTLARAMLAFIEESPTAFHAVAAVERRLEGYTRLEEGEAWRLVPGGRYYVTRNGSSLVAFRLPQGQWQGFLLAAAHSDSPTFKLKEDPMLPGTGYLRLNAEPYGGMLRAAWADRPLGVAGRLLVGREGRIGGISRAVGRHGQEQDKAGLYQTGHTIAPPNGVEHDKACHPHGDEFKEIKLRPINHVVAFTSA